MEPLHEGTADVVQRRQCPAGAEELRSVQGALGSLSWSPARLGEQLHARRAAVQLRRGRAEIDVHDERHRERELQLSQGDEAGRVSQ